MHTESMTSSRSYLIRAIYQWIVDNGATPHLLVDASYPGVVVPKQYVENNKIILNIGPLAAHGLILGNDQVEFSARFSGQTLSVIVPTPAVLAIYARENGQGMVFNEEKQLDKTGTGAEIENQSSPKSPKRASRPNLRVVK